MPGERSHARRVACERTGAPTSAICSTRPAPMSASPCWSTYARATRAGDDQAYRTGTPMPHDQAIEYTLHVFDDLINELDGVHEH
jgi:hypothetical protein